MNKILEAIKNRSERKKIIRNRDEVGQSNFQGERKKIIRNRNGVGGIDFDGEITPNNVVKTCEALMDSDYLYIRAAGEGKVCLPEKWLEHQWKRNEKVKREEKEVFLCIKKEELHGLMSDLMESKVYEIVIYDSMIENDFFDVLIQNRYNTWELMKEGLVKSLLYLAVEDDPFDISYAYSLAHEPPFLKGKYYEMPFQYEL